MIVDDNDFSLNTCESLLSPLSEQVAKHSCPSKPAGPGSGETIGSGDT